MKMRNKKGLSHVELVVSFAIFVAFVAAVFLYIRPVKEPTLSSVMLNIAENSLRDATSVAIGITPFSVSEPQGDCFELKIPIPEKYRRKNIAILDSKMNLTKFYINDSLFAKVSKSEGKFDSFYYILYTDEDISGLQNTYDKVCSEPTYRFSVPRVSEVLSLSKLLKAKAKYSQDYEALKKEWNFPKPSDFSIKVTSQEVNIKMEKEIPEGVDVHARELKSELFENKTASMKEVKIHIKVW